MLVLGNLEMLRRKVATGLLCALSMLPATAPAAEKVTYNMAWLPQGSVGGTIVAKAKGFFAEEGLDVELTRGYGGQRTVNEVDQGLFDIGYGDPPSVILNNANGGRTVLVGAINTRWPAGLCFVEDGKRHPKTPAELKGMTVAGGAGSPVQNIVPAWLKMNGLPPDSIKLLRMEPAVINSALIEGRVDLAECWEGANMPLLDFTAAQASKKVNHVLYRDFGLHIYGNGFVTSQKMMRERPEVLRKFLRASYKGYRYMATNPDDSANAIAGLYPTLNKGVLTGQIKQTADLLSDPGQPDQQMGFLRDDRMANTFKFTTEAFGVGDKLNVKQLYSNEFLK